MRFSSGASLAATGNGVKLLKSPIKLNQLLVVERDYFDYAMIAIAAHENQKYGQYPYSYHLAMVDNYICDFGFSEHNYRAAAWLHDVIEDTPTTAADVADVFGSEIAMLVWACTGVGINRKERNACIYKRLKHHPDAAPVKCADRYANVKFALKEGSEKKLRMYVDEWPEFRENVMPLMVNKGDHRKSYFFNCLDDLMTKAKEELDAKPENDVKPEPTTTNGSE